MNWVRVPAESRCISGPPPRRGPAETPLAAVIVCTSWTSAAPAALPGGHERSGEVQSCHVTRVVLPNDALFIHGCVAALSARAAARSAKSCLAIAASTENGFGKAVPVPRFEVWTVALPSERTSIV